MRKKKPPCGGLFTDQAGIRPRSAGRPCASMRTSSNLPPRRHPRGAQAPCSSPPGYKRESHLSVAFSFASWRRRWDSYPSMTPSPPLTDMPPKCPQNCSVTSSTELIERKPTPIVLAPLTARPNESSESLSLHDTTVASAISVFRRMSTKIGAPRRHQHCRQLTVRGAEVYWQPINQGWRMPVKRHFSPIPTPAFKALRPS